MEIKLYQKYKQAESYFESLQNMTKENFFKGNADPQVFFDRAKKFLSLAGNPDKTYKIIHVAGTSGKGSTVNYISKILVNDGNKVGTHYSPFVSVATEKIQINHKLIPVKDFIELVEEMKPIIEKMVATVGIPSYFECWMVASLLYFKKKKVDYVVLETGCGGRFDASNAVAKTEYQIITNIGLDHTQFLGTTIEKIAFEKAGIIRKKGKCITTATQPSVIKIFEKVCQERGSNLDILDNQSEPNKALAIHVAQKMGIDDRIIQKSIKEALNTPSRFEIMQKKPLVILDGAHNHDKINYLVNKILLLDGLDTDRPKVPASARTTNGKIGNIHLVVAMTDKKDPKDVFKPFKDLFPQIKHVYATRFLNSFRMAMNPEEIKKAFRNKAVTTHLDPNDALKLALKNAKANDLILITGSFFLCCDLRKRWISEEKQLEQRSSFPK